MVLRSKKTILAAVAVASLVALHVRWVGDAGVRRGRWSSRLSLAGPGLAWAPVYAFSVEPCSVREGRAKLDADLDWLSAEGASFRGHAVLEFLPPPAAPTWLGRDETLDAALRRVIGERLAKLSTSIASDRQRAIRDSLGLNRRRRGRRPPRPRSAPRSPPSSRPSCRPAT